MTYAPQRTFSAPLAGYVLALMVVALDQWSKASVATALVYAEQQFVTPWLNLTLVYNTGAAFSFLNDAGGWQRWFFVGLALTVSALLVNWLRFARGARAFMFAGLALILGGAVGNLIDRLRLGHVVDFIQVHYESWYYPAFNIADSAITVGAALLIWDGISGAAGREARRL